MEITQSSKRAKVTEVFTPRRAEVNPAMYVERPLHERKLKRSVEGSLHTIIAGESGNGKSWLYKKVSLDNDWKLFCGNFGNAQRFGSVSAEIFNTIVPTGSREWNEHEETLGAELNTVIAKGGSSSTRKYSVKKAELVETAFKKAKQLAKSRIPVLVLDNLEAIFRNKQLMDELGNIILLLDDERYAQYGVKLLIVGVPSNIVEYYQHIENLEPVGNSLEEIPVVQSLTLGQVEILVTKGFQTQLKLTVSDITLKNWARKIHEATMGIAQRLHEYCEKLAYLVEDNGWKVPERVLEKSDLEFVSTSLHQSHAVVENCMNDRETRTGRRNQVLYALGKIKTISFEKSEVEKIVREYFPKTTNNVSLAIGQILTDLTKEGRDILCKTVKGNSYRFKDPKYMMCLRLILIKSSDDETVSRRPLKR